MAIAFDLLPTELQATIIDLRADGVPEAHIDTLIARTLTALGTKSNKVQIEVWQMEERLGTQLKQIGDKLQGDLQSQHGVTNTMLADLNTAWLNARPLIEEAGRGIAEIKKLWSELDDWRSRVEGALLSFSAFRKESTDDRQQIRDAIHTMDDRHGGQIEELLRRIGEIERYMELSNHQAGG